MIKLVTLTVERMNRFEGEGTARAFCDVAIGGSFLIKGIKVLEGKKGLFVNMPREKGKDDQWYGTVIPLSKEAYQQLSETVLTAYHSETTPSTE